MHKMLPRFCHFAPSNLGPGQGAVAKELTHPLSDLAGLLGAPLLVVHPSFMLIDSNIKWCTPLQEPESSPESA